MFIAPDLDTHARLLLHTVDFEITHSPAHTEYQMALFVSIDGAHVAFTGDAFFTNPTAPMSVSRADLLATKEKLRKQTDLFEQVIADKDCNFGLDPSWVKIYPYQMVIKPGETAHGEIRVQNYRSAPMKMEVALVLPEGWISQPDVLRFEAPAHGHASSAFTLRTTRERPSGQTRIAIAADVMADGKYLGQMTEAVVDLPG